MKWSRKISKWIRHIHRDLGFLFAGMVIIYALSGLFMNHRRQVSPKYTITVKFDSLTYKFSHPEATSEEVVDFLRKYNEEKNYTKHYYPKNHVMKVFLKGGSNILVDTRYRRVKYEKLSRRPIISTLARLHYNTEQWWVFFSDFFAISLLIITITGLFLVKGRHGLKGYGGIELLIGLILPFLFLLLL